MKKIPPHILPVLTLLLLPALLFADKPLKKEDPKAGKNHAVRGSRKELETLKKNAAPVIKKGAKKNLPAGSEVRKTLGKKERPALRFLRQGKAAPKAKKTSGGFGVAGAGANKNTAPKYPQHKNKLENKKIKPLKAFEVQYTLEDDARVTFTIADEAGVPLHKLKLAAGEFGGRAGKNKISIWDGRDAAGREADAGEYRAVQEIDYEGYETIIRIFSLTK